MPMFCFCKTLVVDERQFLVRAANVSALVFPRGSAFTVEYKLVIDTTVPLGAGWHNLRLALDMHNQGRLLKALECFDERHARQAWILFEAHASLQVSADELLEGARFLEGLLTGEVLRRYGVADF